MKEAKKFINKHSVPAQNAEHYFGHNEKVVDVITAKEAIKMAYDNGCKNGYGEGAPTQDEKYEPYFGWCDVDGCENEGITGGNAWRDTGYWTVCSEHSTDNRNGLKQPKMKQIAINREKTRGKDGVLADVLY